MQEQPSQSILTLENRSALTITAVDRVESFHERQIVLTIGGKRATISGEKLHMISFSQGGGTLVAEGRVDGIRFGAGKRIAALFK